MHPAAMDLQPMDMSWKHYKEGTKEDPEAMCGICGQISFNGQPSDVASVFEMTQVLKKRGPDALGLHVHGGNAIGHRRLKIIDLSGRAHQPMVDNTLGLSISIGFKDVNGEAGNEFAYSDIVARHYGTDHQKIEARDEQVLPALDNCIRSMSEPMVSLHRSDRRFRRLRCTARNFGRWLHKRPPFGRQGRRCHPAHRGQGS
jgi:asparagine synthetase B (glutamine-hydrolysing)